MLPVTHNGENGSVGTLCLASQGTSGSLEKIDQTDAIHWGSAPNAKAARAAINGCLLIQFRIFAATITAEKPFAPHRKMLFRISLRFNLRMKMRRRTNLNTAC